MNEQALARFREACGLSGPLALEWDSPGQSAAGAGERAFDCPFVLVGRHRRSDLCLEDSTVSRRHAYLQAVSGGILVTDLESRAKVFWEGEESARPQGWFEPEKYIRVGQYRIRLRCGRIAGD